MLFEISEKSSFSNGLIFYKGLFKIHNMYIYIECFWRFCSETVPIYDTEIPIPFIRSALPSISVGQNFYLLIIMHYKVLLIMKLFDTGDFNQEMSTYFQH